jgi:hypothetical protein
VWIQHDSHHVLKLQVQQKTSRNPKKN